VWCVTVTATIRLIKSGASDAVSCTFLSPIVSGTPEYLAPEMLLPGSPHDRSVDCWSLGVLLYETLIGMPPFSGDDREETYENISSLNYSFPASPAISSSAKELISMLLRQNPAQRLSMQDVLLHPWIQRHAAVQNISPGLQAT